eukprot:CAMPEP_0168602458 /NCGR_PEP_ID=MMETSP0420-20121227/14104_1 /TAXON_ID=498008 /ORGANISM="Pessonella sp." /LENGTH=69 /DNA_ID=CAMNT_0008641169 /DNA_START=19 /DNA_END=225 /DNA_ORIENTATION=-
MLVTGTSQGNVVLWDVVSGNPLYKRLVGHKTEISCIGVSRDDSLIASGGDDGRVVLWGYAGESRSLNGQ